MYIRLRNKMCAKLFTNVTYKKKLLSHVFLVLLCLALFYIRPMLTTYFFLGFVLVKNVVYTPSELKFASVFSLLVLVYLLAVIVGPFNPTGGELGVEYLKISFRSSFNDLYAATYHQVFPYASIKVFQQIMSFFAGTELHERSVLAPTFLRILFSSISSALIYQIVRELTKKSTISIGVALIATMLFSFHYYVWFYLNGDQFRNAFANLFMLSIVYVSISSVNQLRWKYYFFVIILILATIFSHRAYIFVLLAFVYSYVFYLVIKYMQTRLSFSGLTMFVKSPFVLSFFPVVIHMLTISMGLFVLVKYTGWAAESVFTGQSMDIKNFQHMSHMQRLLVPGELFQIFLFSFISITTYLRVRQFSLDNKYLYVLYLFYSFGFTLSHTWLFLFDIDLSRLFVVFYPFAAILFTINVVYIAGKLFKTERNMMIVSLLSIVCFLGIFTAKLLYETSFNNETTVPLIYPFFYYDFNDILKYVFGDIGIYNNEGYVFIFLSLVMFFTFLISFYYSSKFHLKKLLILSLTMVLLPGLLVMIWSLIYNNYTYYSLKYKANLNDVNAQYQLGRHLDYLSHNSNLEAIKWFDKAANNGHIKAQYNLAMWLSTAEIDTYKLGKKNDSLAFKWFYNSYKSGNSEAEFSLARHYERGLGVKQNCNKAMQLYLSAASKNKMFDTQYRLAQIYHDGLCGFEKDYSKAYKYYKIAYDNGVTYALSQMNRINKATDYFQRLTLAYKSGDIDVAYELAVIYESGGVVSKDCTKALFYYMEAAERNNLSAIFRLGEIYGGGLCGATINSVLANKYYKKAEKLEYDKVRK